MKCALLAGAAALAVFSTPAFAAADAAPADAGAKAPALEEIVVTAQHREENLQKVPIAITAVSGATIVQSGFRDITDIQYLAPSLQYDPTNGGAFQIRGVGSESFDFSNEKSVSTVIDNVVMDAPRNSGLIGLTDLTRVDVLRGPQGTLFGKNATSGAISVTTGDPVIGQFTGKVEASYGERDDRNVNAVFNIPVSDQVALRLTGFAQGQSGYGEYTFLQQPLGSTTDSGIRGKLLYRPSSDLTIILEGDYARHWDNQDITWISMPANFAAESIAAGATPSAWNVDNADDSLSSLRTVEWGSSLHIKYALGNDTLTSITAYHKGQFSNNFQLDFSPDPDGQFLPINNGAERNHKFSEELRLTSPTGQFFEYVVGLFYNKLVTTQTQIQWGNLDAGVSPPVLLALTSISGANSLYPGSNEVYFQASNESTAGYGQVKFNFTPELSLALGARYTHDDNGQSLSGITNSTAQINALAAPIVGYDPILVPISGVPTQYSGSVTHNNFSYRIAPTYQITPNVMAYATWSTGYKAPGVAFVSNIYDPYFAETVKSLEVGMKTELLDHTLRLNVDFFDEHFTNFQAQIQETINGLPEFVIGNAGGLKSVGVEGDISWQPVRALRLNAAVTYDDAKFTNYVDGTNVYTGDVLSNAPKWAGNLGALYTSTLGNALDMKASLNYSIKTGSYSVIGNPESLIPTFGILNGRITLTPKDSSFQFGVYGRNMLNTHFNTGFILGVAGSNGRYTSQDAYRTLGAFVGASF